MKFNERVQQILNESSSDISPKELSKLDDDMRRMIVFYKDGDWDSESVEDVKDIKKFVKKDYKWDGKIWQNKKYDNQYIVITTP